MFLALRAHAEDPTDAAAAALRTARTHIAAKEFVIAAAALESSFATASTIPNATERNQALTALHFYAAVAYSGMQDDANARRHLNDFFTLSPKANRIDATKYDKHFVALFNELVANRQTIDGDTFEAYYPPFSQAPASEADSIASNIAAMELLATPSEKHEWRSLATTKDRDRFMQNFWARRDPNRETPENEFRETFNRRLAFAQSVFGLDDSGLLTDRGRVFTLLGRPAFVRRRPIRREDLTGHNRVWIATDAIINGTIEQWAYTREQLPMPLSKPTITYRFVTQAGIGVGVLQKEDAYAMQALEAATNPSPKH